MKTITRISLIAIIAVVCFPTIAKAEIMKWNFATNERIYTIPLVKGDVVYFGSVDKVFYAIDKTTGDEIWHYETDNKIFSSPALYDTILCFASGNHLIMLSTTGHFLHDFTMLDESPVNEHDAWDNFNSSPYMVDSIAYVGCDKGHVYGINVKTGEQVFHCQVPDATQTIDARPVVSDSVLMFGNRVGVFYAYNIKTEEKIWEYDTKKDGTYSWIVAMETNPVVYNGSVLFAGRSCNLYSLDIATGSKNWMFHDPQNMWLLGGLALDDSIIYLGSSNQFIFQAFNAKTGTVIWTSHIDGRAFGMPYYDDNYVYIGSGRENADKAGSLYAIDKQNGALHSRYKVSGQAYGGPTVADSIIFFGCADKNLYALDLKNFLEHQYADSYIEDPASYDLGGLKYNQTIDTSFYIHNKGEGTDSVYLVNNNVGITVTPKDFSLAPSDSQKINVNIDASLFTPMNYTKNLTFGSFNTLVDKTIKMRLDFKVLNELSGVIEVKEDKYFLGQNYPNPFSVNTIIPYHLDKEMYFCLSIFDLNGKLIEIIAEGNKGPGFFTGEFNANNLPIGNYFCKLKTESNVSVIRLSLSF